MHSQPTLKHSQPESFIPLFATSLPLHNLIPESGNLICKLLATMDSRIPQKTFPLLDLPGELRDMIYEQVLFASAVTTDISQRRANLEKGVQIHTNILLISRQVFEEARNVMIGTQLVQVITRGGVPENWRIAAAIEDGIPLFHPRYRKFCLLKHRSEYP